MDLTQTIGIWSQESKKPLMLLAISWQEDRSGSQLCQGAYASWVLLSEKRSDFAPTHEP